MTGRNKNSGGVIAGLAFGLAGGIALGVFALAPNLADGANQHEAQQTAHIDQAQQQLDIAQAQASSADTFIDTLSLSTVAATLKDQAVMLFVAPDANQNDVDALRRLLDAAEAREAGVIELKDKFFNQDGADSLKNIVSNTLPAGAELSVQQRDAGTHSGESLGSAVMLSADNAAQATNEERAIVLDSLKEAGFLEYQEGTILPAQAAIIVLGNDDGSGNSYTAHAQAKFAQALKSRSRAVVMAGEINTASDTGAIGIVRSEKNKGNSVSSVDSVNRAWGRIASVLALREQLEGQVGAYGAAANADATSPVPHQSNASDQPQ
ncbi:copper transporter [Corynebacterium sp. sy017]|uniref:copper transporter n=1 Tax=unclassified Corynebacterium TaxID=2624378 RepID=UPI0011871912|nr:MULTISPECIES: copper transporter [unclassified Corynebacterium]MBP3087555.1 copper transporter [Corynebacterium sp. sy017]TSD92133.1 copper transporter [Corynebacterium sp. SY003]